MRKRKEVPECNIFFGPSIQILKCITPLWPYNKHGVLSSNQELFEIKMASKAPNSDLFLKVD